MADFFYDHNGQPHMDRTYRAGLKPFNDLTWVDVSDRLPTFIDDEKIDGLGDWLRTHDVDKIAPYARGRSAQVFALKLKSGEIKALRYGRSEPMSRETDKTKTWFKNLHTRIKSPLVLQPQAHIENLLNSHSIYHAIKNLKEQHATVLEILPMIPVLPNDIAGIETVSGHDTYFPDPLSTTIISTDSWSRLEGQKTTFCAYLISQGFDLSRVADIGVLPDGTLIFVDPDTLKEGERRIPIASARAQNLIGQVLPADIAEQFKWVDGDCARSERILLDAKQHRFFPNPYQTSTLLTPTRKPDDQKISI